MISAMTEPDAAAALLALSQTDSSPGLPPRAKPPRKGAWGDQDTTEVIGAALASILKHAVTPGLTVRCVDALGVESPDQIELALKHRIWAVLHKSQVPQEPDETVLGDSFVADMVSALTAADFAT